MSSLADERRYTHDHLGALRREADAEGHGFVVLIHEGAVAGFFKSEAEATGAGFEWFGSSPFFVRDLDPAGSMVASNFTR